MKRGKQIHIHLNFSNRVLYTFITLAILIVAGIGVYAATYAVSGAGHPYTEITTCANGQILKMVNGVWACGSDVDTDTNGPIPGGLYGRCYTSYSASYSYAYCLSNWATEPAYCTASGSGGCMCRSGYTRVVTGHGKYTFPGQTAVPRDYEYYYSCMKN